MKKTIFFLFAILGVLIIFTFVSCDNNGPKTYPSWFNEYSGDRLIGLKTVQDSYDCFGATIGPNVIIYGTPMSDIVYTESPTERTYMITFGTRNNVDLVYNTDIKPFKDAVLASGFVYDSDSDSYAKGNVKINIYVIAMTDDPHFEFIVEETF